MVHVVRDLEIQINLFKSRDSNVFYVYVGNYVDNFIPVNFIRIPVNTFLVDIFICTFHYLNKRKKIYYLCLLLKKVFVIK